MPKRHPNVSEKREEITRQLLLAEQGEVVDQNTIAAKLAQGYFIKRNLAGALYWYAQAVKRGYTYSKWNAGTMLIVGEGVDSPHVELGMKLIEQAAESGDESACDFLAECYSRGSYGKERNTTLSAHWSARARDHNRFVEYGSPFDIEASGITLLKPKIEWS